VRPGLEAFGYDLNIPKVSVSRMFRIGFIGVVWQLVKKIAVLQFSVHDRFCGASLWK